MYYLPYITILGTKGCISSDRYIEKILFEYQQKASDYITGLHLVNKYRFTPQDPSCIEICSNEVATKRRKQIIDGNPVIVYKSAIRVTAQNKPALYFFDLMTVIDK